MLSIIFFCFPTRAATENDLEVKTRDELLSSPFHFLFFSPFFNKNTPMYKSFLLLHSSSHYLYQFPFSSMKQKLTKNRIRFSDLTTTMLKHYFASFLCLTVHDNIITILEEYSLLTQYLIFYI